MRLLSALFTTLLLSSSLFAQLRISQAYGGGGNAGSTFRNDFIEVFNAGPSAASVNGMSVQYASAAGTSWQVTNLPNVSLLPGQYLLIQEAQGAGGTTNLPTPEATGTIAMSATAGKVALVTSTTALTGACPTAGVVDFLGFGSTASCSETAPSAAPSNTNAVIRNTAGCTDTGSNLADFTAALPTPRNTVTSVNPCGGSSTPLLSINDVSQAEGTSGGTTFTFTVSLNIPAPAGGVTFDIATADNTATTANSDYVARSLTSQTILATNSTFSFAVTVNGDTNVEATETFFVNITNVTGATVSDAQGQGTIVNDDFSLVSIANIQGSGLTSPLVGQTVSTQGIVTALASNGYFLQTPDASIDSDINTSEGIFVFTNSAPTVTVASLVTSTGVVTEFKPSNDPNSRTITEITQASVLTSSTGNPLPAPVNLIAPTPTGGPDQLERFEGMRVQVPGALNVVAPTGGGVTESSATASSDGVLFAVFPGTTTPFREAGIELLDFPVNAATACAAGANCALVTFDANPERIRLDTNAIALQTAVNVNTGATLTGVVGVLTYTSRSFTILTTQAPTVGGTPQTTTSLIPNPNSITIAAMNVERFFDSVNDPGIGEPVLTSVALDGRLTKVSLAVRTLLNNPDIIGLEEVENLTALGLIADRIRSQGGANYTPYLVEGNDQGGIDVGFLVRADRVSVTAVTQLGSTLTYLSPCSNNQELLNDRPTLRLRVTAITGGNSYTVFVNHLRSLIGVGATTLCDLSTDGARVRAKRAAQANYVAGLVQDELTTNPNANIVLVGDFNAFDVNDGYVDSINTIMSTPAPATQVHPAPAAPAYAPLTNLVSLLPAAQRYSYVFDGNHQTIDHALMNPAAKSLFMGGGYLRINADFNEATFRGNFNTPERYSDHDPVFVRLSNGFDISAQFGVTKTIVAFNRGTRLYSSTISLTNNSGNTIAGANQLAITELPPGVALANANFPTPAGGTFTLPNTIAPGQTVSVPMQFTMDVSKPLTYKAAIFTTPIAQ
jgi:predicted extracellular nuclease